MTDLLANPCAKAMEKDFLSVLTSDSTELVEIAFANPGTSRFNRAIYLNCLTELELLTYCQQDRNVSFATGFSNKLRQFVALNKETNRQGCDKFVSRKRIISFDIDFKDNAIDACNDFDSIDTLSSKILGQLKKQNISPWLLVFSGNGLHLHFKLDQPYEVASIQNYKQIYDICLSYLERLLNLSFDATCSNPSRLMRIPFSTNWKNQKKPIQCKVLFHDNEANFSQIWRNFESITVGNLVAKHDNFKDKRAIIESLNLQIVLDHFGYEKSQSITKRALQIVCSSPFNDDSDPSFFYDCIKKVFFDFSKNIGGDLFHLIALFANLNVRTEFSKVIELAAEIADIQGRDPCSTTGFKVDEKGVWFLLSPNANPLWLSSPIYVAALTRDTQGQSWGRLLSFKDQDNVLKSWPMPMELLAKDGCEVRKNLLRLGVQLAIGCKERHLFLSYLQSAQPEKRVRCVNRIGWHQGNFVLPDDVILRKGEKAHLILQANCQESSFGTSGTLLEWQHAIGILCPGNSRLVFAVSAAFASVIMSLVNAETGGFHFVGPSSIGKSITLKIAGSVWGNPGINGFIKRWRSTLNGLELIAASRCDALLLLDELGEIPIKDAGLAAYMLSGGVSKNRATKYATLANSFEWRLIFLSSGEVTLSSQGEQAGYNINAGQEIRMIDLPAQATHMLGIFENIHAHSSAGVFAAALSENSERYYGTPIRDFLTKLIDDSAINDKAQILLQEFIDKIGEDSHGQINRVIKRFALVGAAGELAAQYGTLPWEEGEAFRAAQRLFADWRAQWSSTGMRESQKLVAQIKSLLQEFGPSRFPILQDLRRRPQDQHLWGFRKETDNRYDWVILSEIFRNHFCRGFDYGVATKSLKALGFLISSSSPVRVPHLGVTRAVTLCGSIIS